MVTIAHSEYLLLNSIQRDGYKDQSQIEHFEFLKKNRWIERCEPTAWEFTDESTVWRLSSQGRLEHNLYERINYYRDGYQRKRPEGACPRCWNEDENCPICCGYKAR